MFLRAEADAVGGAEIRPLGVDSLSGSPLVPFDIFGALRVIGGGRFFPAGWGASLVGTGS